MSEKSDDDNNDADQMSPWNSPVMAGRKGSLAATLFLSEKGTLSISGVTQFKELQNQITAVKLGINKNTSDFWQCCISSTESSSVKPGPSVHHHSCRGRKPTYAGESSLTSPDAPWSVWPESQKNLPTNPTTLIMPCRLAAWPSTC